MKIKLSLHTASLSFLLAIVFLSCKKVPTESGEIAPLPESGTPILPTTPVEGIITGIVTNENDQPIAAANVTIAGATYLTDDKGFFNTGKLTLDKYISSVQVSKQGYFKTVRSFPANAGRNYVAIKLIPKVLSGSFASTAAGNISLSNGTQISFTSNSIVDKTTGAAHTGNIKVYSAYIDPTANDIGASVPGSFIGQDNTNMFVLASAGMLAVEMESDAGAPLQLASGKTAGVKLLTPASLQASAPATIATWSLDDRGVWKKEGTATKNGNYYEFAANHFSFWNCDIPNSSIYLDLHLQDATGAPLNNVYVKIQPVNNTNPWGPSSHGYTDSAGNARALIPANLQLRMMVMPNYGCSNAQFYTQLIGPFTANSNLTITATPSNVSSVTVQGNAVKCNGTTPIQQGMAVIYVGNLGTYHVNITNGSFSRTIYSCTPITNVKVFVIDFAAQYQSTTNTVPVVGTSANAGTMIACNSTTDEFIYYVVDGVVRDMHSYPYSGPFTGTPPPTFYTAIVPNVSTNVSGAWRTATMISYNMLFKALGASTGTFGISNNDSLTIDSYYGAVRQPSASVTFTSFGLTGQYLEGNFNIPFTHASTGTTVHSCTGNFRLRRN